MLAKEEIRCPYCRQRGYNPTLLGKVSADTHGTLALWCKNCRKEVIVEVDGKEMEFK